MGTGRADWRKGDSGASYSPFVLFAGGGTGGHLMPALATARVLRDIAGKADSAFLISDRLLKFFHGPLQEYRTFPVPEVRWVGSASAPAFAVRSAMVMERTLDVFRSRVPDMVVGMGGWGCGPAVLTAHMMRVPSMLFEANAVPGRAVRALAALCDVVQLQWPVEMGKLKCGKLLACGTPVRPELLTGNKREACRRYGLDPCRTTVLVAGGTQGALALNRLLMGALPLFASAGLRFQILHITGPEHLQEYRVLQPPENVVYRPVGFEQEMADAYAAADFAVCRAGGGTLAELSALGLPAILVPYPHCPDGHQLENAKKLAEAGGALLLEQSSLNPAKLAEAVTTLVERKDLRIRMKKQCLAAGRPRAARDVAMEIITHCRSMEYYSSNKRKNAQPAGMLNEPPGRAGISGLKERLPYGGKLTIERKLQARNYQVST